MPGARMSGLEGCRLPMNQPMPVAGDRSSQAHEQVVCLSWRGWGAYRRTGRRDFAGWGLSNLRQPIELAPG